VAAAVQQIVMRHPGKPAFLLGFSLGGNFALRIAARAGDLDLGLTQVVAVCPVLQPHSTMQALESGLWIYRDYFLRRWRRSLMTKAAAFPQRYDFGNLKRLPTLTATTEFFVKRYTEYPDLDSYLEGYSITGRVLESLSVPSHLIATRDDPVIPMADLASVARSDLLQITLAERGGHCAFLENFRLGSWIDRCVLLEFERASAGRVASRDAFLRTSTPPLRS
jgi:predicted alpha/beta-fold hydrolase